MMKNYVIDLHYGEWYSTTSGCRENAIAAPHIPINKLIIAHKLCKVRVVSLRMDINRTMH